MNVIVSNKQKNIIDNANIDAIKDLNGLFSVDDLINKFKNYFFSKMILDATSVIDFTSDNVLNKLAKDIGSDRLIILLPASPEPPKEFTDKLINLKIYNFSNKIEDIVKFINYPNTQGVVSEDSSLYVDNSIKENDLATNNFSNNMVNSNNSYSDMLSNFDINENTDENTNNISVDNVVDNNSLNNDVIENNNVEDNLSLENTLNNVPLMTSDNANIDVATNNVENDIPVSNIEVDNYSNNKDVLNQGYEVNNIDNINSNVNNIVNENNNENIYENDQNYENNDIEINNNNNNNNNVNLGGYLNQSINKKIIGIKNVTIHAGSTTLTYLLMNMLKNKYKKRVSAIEINKNDFKYYQDNTMLSVSAGDITNILNNNDEIIIVDLNDCHDTSFCNEILYLVEPSIIKLNKLMMENRFIFRELQNKKIILNKSMLSSNDVKALSKEAGVEMFMNIPPVNDRINNQIIEDLIKKIDII